MTAAALRPATLAHAPLIAEMHGRCFVDAWNADSVAATLTAPGTLAWLAFEGEDPVGFIILRQAGDEAEILSMGVMPGARRRGLGAELLNQAVSVAMGVSVFLEVAADNSAARALYAARGFLVVGRRRGYYPRHDGPAADALILELASC